jgi:hypothetical protein
MHCPSFLNRRLRRVLPVCLLCAYATAANSTDTYSGGKLSIPSVTIGAATFTNMVVQVGTIVVPPSGSSGNGTSDTYDPASNRLTVPNVLVGATTYHNVVVTVGSLTSVQSVSGADSYSPPNLTISSVQVGTLTYHDVTITVGKILSAAGGMPNAVEDIFAGGRLQIPAVQVGARVYTNATITVGSILSVGSVEVPDVRGVSQVAATTLLGAAHLAPGMVTSAASSSVPVGGVISQSPAPGTRVALGSTVSLVVSTGSGGGGGGGIGTGVGWIPFIAAPATGKTPVGQNGLFVLAPDPLAATEANINWILPNTGVIALGASFVLQGTAPGSGFWPYAGIYAALNSQQVVDIYQVNLTDASSGAPAAFPVGNFAARKVPGIALICDFKSSQSNLLDPTTWFVVVHIGASGSCGTSTATGDSWVVVTATATQTVAITTTQIEFLHDPNGLLTALVLNDPATHDILMYTDRSFTNPATLFAGATTDVIVHAQKSAINSGAVGNGELEFRELGNGTTNALYRLDYTGPGSFKAIPSYNPGTDTLSQDSILTGTKADANNVYFTVTNLAGATETLYQEPIGAPGSTPPAPIALYTGGVSPVFSVLGSNGSVVVLETITPGAPATSSLGTVPVGVAATATQTPLGPAGGYSGSLAKSQMIVGNGSDYADPVQENRWRSRGLLIALNGVCGSQSLA